MGDQDEVAAENIVTGTVCTIVIDTAFVFFGWTGYGFEE